MKKQRKSRRNRHKIKPRQKKPTPTRKPVETFFHFTAKSDERGTIPISIDEQGRITCSADNVSNVKTFSRYKRKSGKDKIVSQTTSSSNSGFIKLSDEINYNYDIIAGIDTNDYIINDQPASITAAYCSDAILTKDSKEVYLQITPSFLIMNVRKGVNAEVIGWYLFIFHI